MTKEENLYAIPLNLFAQMECKAFSLISKYLHHVHIFTWNDSHDNKPMQLTDNGSDFEIHWKN